MKVVKFGGSSVADAGQIRKVFEIVKSDPDRRIVVVSAPGKRSKSDVKVTDLLIRVANASLAGKSATDEMEAVVKRFAEIEGALGLSSAISEAVRRELRDRVSADKRDADAFADAIKAIGEDYCARLVAEIFRSRGMNAHYVNPGEAGLILSDEPGNAQVQDTSYKKLAKLSEHAGVIVFPGFFGYTEHGRIVTFPRGGSDITGAILAAAVRADVYENFTDVDSVYVVDPSIVADAEPIRMLTYREMRELSYAGFSVFHDEAIVPVVRAGVPIAIRNTNRPEARGTWVVPERPYQAGTVVGISSSGGFSTIFLSKYLMNREIGFGRRLLQILEEEGLPFEHTPSGIDNMSVILRSELLVPEKESRVVDRMKRELAPDDIEVEHGLALIMVVGEGMRYTVGLAARATHALAEAGVNIEMMNQGSSEISMMFGVKEPDRKRAVVALYREFFEAEERRSMPEGEKS